MTPLRAVAWTAVAYAALFVAAVRASPPAWWACALVAAAWAWWAVGPWTARALMTAEQRRAEERKESVERYGWPAMACMALFVALHAASVASLLWLAFS